MAGMVKRGLDRIKTMVANNGREPVFGPRELNRIREQLTECAERLGGEVSARTRAAKLGETYLKLGDAGRREFLRLIAVEFGPDPKLVAAAHESWQASIGTASQWDAETGLRGAMRSRRIRILTQFNALPQGVKFLVDLRADLLRYLNDDPELAALDRELEARLTAWFDVGFLELRRITWTSPAQLLEKLIEYEAVHEIRSWTDLKNRLDSDRRCYAFFHPRMPMEPLIFVEVALTDHLADNVQALLDEHAPVFDTERADTAIFYSISNTQAGLRGVSFGNFLLKRVIDDLKRDFPKLKTFATLSPIPQLASWVKKNPHILKEVGIELEPAQLATGEWSKNRNETRHLREPLLKLAARYLAQAKSGKLPYEPVSRFHLGNGARIERVNPLGDTSFKGFKQSYGMMVNYLYNPDDIEKNVEAFVTDGAVAMSATVRRLSRNEA